MAYIVKLKHNNDYSINYGWKIVNRTPVYNAESVPTLLGTKFSTAGDAIFRHSDYEAEDHSLSLQRKCGGLVLFRIHDDGQEEIVGNLNELIEG